MGEPADAAARALLDGDQQRPADQSPAERSTDQRSLWAIWAFALVCTVSFALFSAHTSELGELPVVWLLATVAFSWVTMTWRGGGLLPRPDAVFALTVATLAGVGAMTGLLMGAGVLDTIRSMVGIPLQAVVMGSATVLLRRRLNVPTHPPVEGASEWRNRWAVDWAPGAALDLLALAGASLISGLVGLAVGSAPGANLWTLSSHECLLWLSHMLAICTVGASATLIIFAAFSPRDLVQPWLQIAGAWFGSVALLAWVHSTGAVNMAWLQVIPTLFIALTCRLWVTALFSLALGAVSVTLSPRLTALDLDPSPVPLGTVMDLLVATLIMVALVLAFLEQRRDALVADLDVERARTARHLEVMQTIFEAMREGIVVLGPDLELRFHNSAAIDLLGRPFPARRSGDWATHFGLTTLDGRSVADTEIPQHEHLVVSAPGGRRVLHQRTLPVSDHVIDGVMVVLADVTQQHERMDELSGFAGVVAHDLRAPLTSLEGWLELAEEAIGEHSPEQAGALLIRARASNRRMRQIIDDWLNYTVERQGALEVTDFPLAAPVNVVMSQLAETGPHRLSLEVPHHVRADLATVRQVLANLIGNASKFSRPGEIPQITVRSHRIEDGWIRVDVEDRGIGLPSGQEESIFDEYQRGSGAATDVEGFGLGLTLCRRVVERHGGTIWARTNAHGGATISFTLPEAQPPEPRTAPRPSSLR